MSVVRVHVGEQVVYTPALPKDPLAPGAKGHRFESCIARTLKGSEAGGFSSLASGVSLSSPARQQGCSKRIEPEPIDLAVEVVGREVAVLVGGQSGSRCSTRWTTWIGTPACIRINSRNRWPGRGPDRGALQTSALFSGAFTQGTIGSSMKDVRDAMGQSVTQAALGYPAPALVDAQSSWSGIDSPHAFAFGSKTMGRT